MYMIQSLKGILTNPMKLQLVTSHQMGILSGANKKIPKCRVRIQVQSYHTIEDSA